MNKTEKELLEMIYKANLFIERKKKKRLFEE